MDDQAVTLEPLHGHVAKLLVRQVHGIAGLKGHHALPATLGDLVSDLDRGAEGIGEIVLEIREMQYLDRAGDGKAALAMEGRDPRMLGILGAIDLLGHQGHLGVGNLLDGRDIHDRQHRVPLDVWITQRDPSGVADGRNAFQQTEDRHGEEKAVGRAHGFGDADGVRHIHESIERAEITAAHHDGISGRLGTDHDRWQGFSLAHQGVVLLWIVDEKWLQGLGTHGFDHRLSLLSAASAAC